MFITLHHHKQTETPNILSLSLTPHVLICVPAAAAHHQLIFTQMDIFTQLVTVALSTQFDGSLCENLSTFVALDDGEDVAVADDFIQGILRCYFFQPV